MLLLGIDDAGRGPLIGPMILAGVLIEKKEENKLKALGAKDSKLLLHTQRMKVAKEIEKTAISHKVLLSTPEDIDDAVTTVNLNTLEAIKSAEIINSLNNKKQKIKVVVDCPSVNTLAWKNKLLTFIKNPENLDIYCEHKADFNHPVVSAASILAKVRREEEVEKIKKQYGNIGSGYPSDPVTKEFLKEYGKKLQDSGIFRKSWATWKALFPEDKKQKTLSEF
ncbi:ribonuclease HII [Candidatus Pacearchaeota archaeon CG_4_9_14_0_2_um_filter_39_13]|nr:ribonuclease HII [Candidatus Pacearchaeota archaeon]OIO42991.1 MAG: ribonuclease HII [Candidatus Pacearchaeota archaeon CG1_02_39_14]PJC45058.1 MAG: ribonuclease HII [Candidatus Pacearchaeota archaeon CG_4_9_14_0_2_um_filter_39_13]